jgi:hypothetical protein
VDIRASTLGCVVGEEVIRGMNIYLKVGILAMSAAIACGILLREMCFNRQSSFAQNPAASAQPQRVLDIPWLTANSLLTPEADAPLHIGVAQQNSGTAEGASSSSSRIDRSVVGTAFPVPDSIETSCGRKNGDFCERQHRALAEMAQEPRDEAWATKTESLIQHEIISQGPGIYSIRNIECRTSICAVEVQSLSGAYVGATYDFLTANNLVDGLRIAAPPETDSFGRQISVAVVIFVRFTHYL